MLYLAQSDTTVGYISYQSQRINEAKKRAKDKKVLQTLDSFKSLKLLSRVPLRHRNMVRRAKKTSFVLANGLAFRVVDSKSPHHALLKKMGPVYSSSANETTQAFNEKKALLIADVIVKDKRGFFHAEASSMYKLSNTHKKSLR